MSRLNFIANATVTPLPENGQTIAPPLDVMQKVEKVVDKVDQLAKSANKQPPILNGSWERRIKVSGIVAATVAATVGGRLLYNRILDGHRKTTAMLNSMVKNKA